MSDTRQDSNGGDQMNWEDFSTRLRELGYFRYISMNGTKSIPKMLDRIKESRSLFSTMVNRDYPADQERLAECGVKDFLLDIMPILQANNVNIDHVYEQCSRDGYDIHVNGNYFYNILGRGAA